MVYPNVNMKWFLALKKKFGINCLFESKQKIVSIKINDMTLLVYRKLNMIRLLEDD